MWRELDVLTDEVEDDGLSNWGSDDGEDEGDADGGDEDEEMEEEGEGQDEGSEDDEGSEYVPSDEEDEERSLKCPNGLTRGRSDMQNQRCSAACICGIRLNRSSASENIDDPMSPFSDVRQIRQTGITFREPRYELRDSKAFWRGQGPFRGASYL